MSESYLGEIRMFAGNFAPQGWMFCNGQLLSISENEPLYALLGTTYGGDGVNTFALPNLQGRIPVGQGTGYTIGQQGGTETVTLLQQQLPPHTHVPNASSGDANVVSPANAVWAKSTMSQFSTAGSDTTMGSGAVVSAGGNQPHNNVMPSLVVQFIISIYGIWPSTD